MEIGYEAYKQGAVESLADRCHREHIHVPAYNYMRALGCILILIEHTVSQLIHSSDIYRLACLITASSFSDIFFIISGCFLLPIRPDGTSQFLNKRLKRLVAPFLVYIAAYILISYLIGDIDLVVMTKQLEWMWLVGGNGVSWFMLVIISCYLFMPFISPWLWHATRRQVEIYLLIWIGASILYLIEPYSHHFQWATAEGAGSWLRLFYNFFGFMVLGYYLVRWPFQSWTKRRKLIAVSAAVVMFLGVTLFYFIFYKHSIVRYFPGTWYSVSMIAKFFLIYILMIRLTRNTGWLYTIVRFLARYSYAIYLCHPIYCWLILPHYFPSLSENYGVRIIFVLGATLLTVWILSKIPIIGKYLR